MAYYQGVDLKKPTGGKKRPHRGKRKHELGSPPTMTRLGSADLRELERGRGGNFKVRLKSALYINVVTQDGYKKARILDVVETPSNPQLARSKIITKGTIVRTELGLVKVTSRPGQHGVLNGVLLKGSA
ncbi:MAG: 30S ribosomal protein S8e [Desulfurococcaceae archaeon]